MVVLSTPSAARRGSMSFITSNCDRALRFFNRLAPALLVATLFATANAPLSAQPPRQRATRAELEEAAMALETTAKTAKNAADRDRARLTAQRIRQRLTDGDFQPGHRILLSVYGDTTLTDTFTVRADRKLLLPNLPPMSLTGVLDSELQAFLAKELSAYLKTPNVQAQGLLRVSILGSVGQPGFYSFPMDFAIGDAIMEAGGPAGQAEMDGVIIRRGGTVAVDKKGMQEAIRLGLTLNDIGVRPGDEVFIPDGGDRKSTWQKVAAVAGIVTGLAWTVSALVR
jgi:protein involved in polysaccharide export with SLBB domain